LSNNKLTKCKACNQDIAKGAKKCVHCGKDQRNFFMRHKIFSGFLILIVFGGMISALSTNDIQETNNIDSDVVNETNENSNQEVNESNVSEQNNDETGNNTDNDSNIEVEANNEEEVDEVPREHKSALKKAETYASSMAMSKAAVYDQLVSEHGEQFPEDAAQYAMDNLNADWKENALIKAETYADEMAMSSDAIYDQLVSDHGEQFTKEEAQYAIDNLN